MLATGTPPRQARLCGKCPNHSGDRVLIGGDGSAVCGRGTCDRGEHVVKLPAQLLAPTLGRGLLAHGDQIGNAVAARRPFAGVESVGEVHGRGLSTLLTLANVHHNPLALGQARQPRSLQCGGVDEYILAAAIDRHKSEALVSTKPPDRAFNPNGW
jgi:hypothetical protein